MRMEILETDLSDIEDDDEIDDTVIADEAAIEAELAKTDDAALNTLVTILTNMVKRRDLAHNKFRQGLYEIETRRLIEEEIAMLNEVLGNPEPLKRFKRRSKKMEEAKLAIQKLLDELNNGINEVAGDLGLSVVG